MAIQAFENLRLCGYFPRAMLDIGAQVGSFTRAFCETFPDTVPIMIEPNPHCQEALSALPFERHAVAAAATNGTRELYLTSEWLQSTGASLYRENTPFFRDEVLMRHPVQAVRLDELLQGRHFDFVKIDVQGAELEDLAYPAMALEMLPRIADAGYIAVPSRYLELLRPEGPHRGYIHHRWTLDAMDGRLVLAPKVTIWEHLPLEHEKDWAADPSRFEFQIIWRGGIDFTLMNGDYLGPNRAHVIEMYKQFVNRPEPGWHSSIQVTRRSGGTSGLAGIICRASASAPACRPDDG